MAAISSEIKNRFEASERAKAVAQQLRQECFLGVSNKPISPTDDKFSTPTIIQEINDKIFIDLLFEFMSAFPKIDDELFCSILIKSALLKYTGLGRCDLMMARAGIICIERYLKSKNPNDLPVFHYIIYEDTDVEILTPFYHAYLSCDFPRTNNNDAILPPNKEYSIIDNWLADETEEAAFNSSQHNVYLHRRMGDNITPPKGIKLTLMPGSDLPMLFPKAIDSGEYYKQYFPLISKALAWIERNIPAKFQAYLNDRNFVTQFIKQHAEKGAVNAIHLTASLPKLYKQFLRIMKESANHQLHIIRQHLQLIAREDFDKWLVSTDRENSIACFLLFFVRQDETNINTLDQCIHFLTIELLTDQLKNNDEKIRIKDTVHRKLGQLLVKNEGLSDKVIKQLNEQSKHGLITKLNAIKEMVIKAHNDSEAAIKARLLALQKPKPKDATTTVALSNVTDIAGAGAGEGAGAGAGAATKANAIRGIQLHAFENSKPSLKPVENTKVSVVPKAT